MLKLRAFLAVFLCALTVRAGVLVHYTFDADFTDSSGNGNDGTLVDTNTLGNTYITNSAAQFGAGGWYKADSEDRVDLATPFTPGTSDTWTVSFWATLSGGAATPVFSSTSAVNYLLLRADVFNGAFLNIAGQGEIFFPVVLGQNSLHHYALVANGTGLDLDGFAGDDRIVLYVDGIAIAPSNGHNTTTYRTDVLVDAFGYANAWNYGPYGTFDEFWILDDALASNRILNLYANNSPNLVLRVDDSATGADDGTSWANAFTNLQDTISWKAIQGDEIWVAAGRYYPDEGLVYPDDDRSATFALFPKLKIYGGFAGTETNLSARDVAANLTILSGDLDKNDVTNSAGIVVADAANNTIGTNSCSVVRMVGTDSNTVLDGFTITSGRADDILVGFNGGGLYCQFGTARIRNCALIGNYADYNGGGILVSDADADLSNCVLFANFGVRGGGASFNSANVLVQHSRVVSNTSPSECGGLFIQNGTLRIEHTILGGNVAGSGGALFAQGGGKIIAVNAMITGNRAAAVAGAAEVKGGFGSFANCTFSGNQAPDYAAVRNSESTTSYFYNCVIWNNRQIAATNAGDSIANDVNSSAMVYNSLVHRSGGSTNWDPAIGTDGDGNVDVDPQFIEALDPAAGPSDAGNFRITYGSPAINSGWDGADLDGPESGTNTASSIDGDLDGASRLVGFIDMGAYEFLDSDADRLSDWQEENIYASDPNDTDSDNDAMDDGDEAYAGTSLTNAASYLGLTSTRAEGTNSVVTWASESNRTYRLWLSTNLVSGTWADLGTYASTPPANTVTNTPVAFPAYYLIGVE
jgi:hypothetical protein